MKMLKSRLVQIFVLFLLFTSCDQKTPNVDFFSKLCDIEIPQKAIIVRDSNEGFLQNSARAFEIKLNTNDFTKLSQSIRKSGYYSEIVKVDEQSYKSSYRNIGGSKAVWFKNENKYLFSNTENSHRYKAEIDTLTHIAIFTEL